MKEKPRYKKKLLFCRLSESWINTLGKKSRFSLDSDL